MRLLLLSKTTAWDIQGEYVRKKVQAGLLPEDHLGRLRVAHDEHYATLEALKQQLLSHHIDFEDVRRGQYFPDLNGFDVVVAIGGDGTVLEASHHIEDARTALIGIRSAKASIGHLCTCGPAEIPELVERLTNGQIAYRSLARLKAKILQVETGLTVETKPVLNDFLFSCANPAGTTRYRLYYGDEIEVQKSSGIWIATPAGSTAAISAAGGSEMDLARTDFQFAVREPFAPPGKKFQCIHGYFDGDKVPFVIEHFGEQAILAFDGQHGLTRLGFGDRLEFVPAMPLRIATRL